jgi:ribonuclease P protein component
MQRAIKRLVNAREYMHVYAHGAACQAGLLKLYAVGTLMAYTRLGIVVSKHVDKRATARNRIKRIIRQWVSQQAPDTWRNHYDIVLKVQKGANITRQGERQLYLDLQALSRQWPLKLR